MRFKNKVIIITGATSGIGAATAKLFSTEGASVYNLDVVAPKHNCNHAQWLKCDITNFLEVQNTIAKIVAEVEHIDYLFANAGVCIEASLVDTTVEMINKVIATNLLGTIYVLKAVLPIMKKQKFGNIVLMGSDQSFIGRENNTIYGATKGAILQLSKSVAIEYAEDNIRVNCVCPGAIITPMMEKMVELEAKRKEVLPEIVYGNIRQTIPVKRLGYPEEVASFVAFLCSKESSFMTGAAISIDGGVIGAH